MLNKDIKSLSDDDLYDKMVKLREMLGHKMSLNYMQFGDSVQASLTELEEEWNIRQFKEKFNINNDPINLGTTIEDDTEI